MENSRTTPFRMESKTAAFDEALQKYIVASLKEKRKAVVPTENIFSYRHGTKWVTRAAESSDSSDANEMQIHSTETSISFKDIIDNDLTALPRHRNAIVEGMMKQFIQTMYQTINDAASKAGNTVNAKGGKFKAEHVIQLLEKVEYSVNRDGSISFPEIHMGPELAETLLKELESQGPDFQERVEEIQKRKSEAAIEKEKGRKSKFPKAGGDNQ